MTGTRFYLISECIKSDFSKIKRFPFSTKKQTNEEIVELVPQTLAKFPSPHYKVNIKSIQNAFRFIEIKH